jgi:hypothetical protein
MIYTAEETTLIGYLAEWAAEPETPQFIVSHAMVASLHGVFVRLAAGPATSADLLTPEERAHVGSLRHALEAGEARLIDIIDRLAPEPNPIDPALVEAVCKRMDLTSSGDRSFALAVLETAHALSKASK